MEHFKIRHFLIIVFLCFFSIFINKYNASGAEKKTDIEKRVNEILSRMTLQEKIGQLVQISAHVPDPYRYEKLIREGRIGSILNAQFDCLTVNEDGVYVENVENVDRGGADRTNSFQQIAINKSRLGIPLLIGQDVIHGFRTLFPVPLAEACSFDEASAEASSRIAAIEATSVGIKWTFAPMVDIARDPRWGRIVEGSGEDPYLGSVMASARVRGFQGASLNAPTSMLATAKHYLCYGAAEGGRDYNTVDVSERTLREVYLPPFEAALKAGAGSVMVAFNEIGGIPSSASPFTIKKLLRGELGFDGIIVSDWGSIGEMINHGVAGNLCDAAVLAIKAGVDIDMESSAYSDNLFKLVKSGIIPESLIDESVRRVLRTKMNLGLFERPYSDKEKVNRVMCIPKHRKKAREIARKSIILLKNEGKLLPIKPDIKTIAVIGPLADDKAVHLGNWVAAGRSSDSISLLEAIKRRVSSGTRVIYSQGCAVESNDKSKFNEAVNAAKSADSVILVVGEKGNMSGEAKSRAMLDLPGIQNDLVKAIHETGKPVVVVLMNGRPLAINWIAENIPAILETWFLGIEGGNAITDVIFGDYNPAGRLAITFPRCTGQIPIYYNHKNTGRPSISKYIDIENKPLFPFGFGLSYTDFSYKNLRISSKTIKPYEKLRIKVDVTNTGKIEGDEVVQLYVRDLVGSTTRPVLELKGFKRIHFLPLEKKTVEFELEPQNLAVLDCAFKPVIEPGKFEIMAGPDSTKGLKGNFEIIVSK